MELSPAPGGVYNAAPHRRTTLQPKRRPLSWFDSYTIMDARRFLVDMGFFPDKVPTEVPSYGAEYSNVHVEASMK